jgi:hypothetical protein
MLNEKIKYLALGLVLAIVASGCAKKVDDYGEIVEMRRFAEDAMKKVGAELRPISKKFDNYAVDLPFYMRPFFLDNPIEIHLVTYKSDRLSVASFTQMEVPPNQGYFLDLAYELRPAANLRAPIFHGDVIKPMTGVDGMFAVDFYNTNPQDVDVDAFLGDQLEEVKRALDLVARYQKTEETGRGKLTPHLKPFKSAYRIELLEPNVDDAEAHRAYFQVVREAFQITLRAYLTALGRLEPDVDPAVAERNKAGHDGMIDTLDKEDIAAKLAKLMFDEDYESYFFKGFWARGVYSTTPTPPTPREAVEAGQGGEQ